VVVLETGSCECRGGDLFPQTVWRQLQLEACESMEQRLTAEAGRVELACV